MDIVSTLKQVAESLFVRRKKWILLTVIGALVVFLPVAYLISREPPRFQTIATIFLESRWFSFARTSAFVRSCSMFFSSSMRTN